MNPNLSDGAKALLEKIIQAGGEVSDEPVPDDFERGWALHPFVGRRAHFFEKQRDVLTIRGRQTHFASLCGEHGQETQGVPLLRPGNYRLCQRCDAALLRSMRPCR